MGCGMSMPKRKASLKPRTQASLASTPPRWITPSTSWHSEPPPRLREMSGGRIIRSDPSSSQSFNPVTQSDYTPELSSYPCSTGDPSYTTLNSGSIIDGWAAHANQKWEQTQLTRERELYVGTRAQWDEFNASKVSTLSTMPTGPALYKEHADRVVKVSPEKRKSAQSAQYAPSRRRAYAASDEGFRRRDW